MVGTYNYMPNMDRSFTRYDKELTESGFSISNEVVTGTAEHITAHDDDSREKGESQIVK